MPEAASESTYCLVANCNADTGSCVTATEVSPPRVKLVAPSATLVVPSVRELFVSAEFGRFVNVLVDPLIDLLVNVSVVALPTKVSVVVGKVKTPVLLIEAMIGVVKVLFVSV